MATKGRKPAYPWKRWADGKERRARFGKDFNCTMAGFRNALYAHARRSDLDVTCSEKPDGLMVFKFSKS